MTRINAYTPLHLSQKGLFIFASLAWLVAGTMLLIKGLHFLPSSSTLLPIKIPIALLAGWLFYHFIFKRVIIKYIAHILLLPPEQKHPFYKAFRPRSYILIAIMISVGVLSRKLEIVPIEYLALFYFTMGSPLLICAVKFVQTAKKS